VDVSWNSNKEWWHIDVCKDKKRSILSEQTSKHYVAIRREIIKTVNKTKIKTEAVTKAPEDM
jgi:phage FluMu protein Com